MDRAQQLLDVWFGAGFFDEAQKTPAAWPMAPVTRRWFNSSKQDDKQLQDAFGDLVEGALAGGLEDWQAQAQSCLALILLLDQLPRNIFRGSERAFAGDARASRLSLDGIASGMEKTLPVAAQVFFYMPLMHAENPDCQQRCIDCFTDLQARVPTVLKPKIAANLRFAREHADIISRFGRFPHRNAVLGRDSSEVELVYLQTANRYGQ